MFLPRKLSLHLVSHDGIMCYASFLVDGIGDVFALVAEHLERELYGSVLGLRHSAVRQLLDEFRLRLDSGLSHEVEGAVCHLLSDALAAESWQLACHRHVWREEEVLALVVRCHAAELGVACAYTLLEVLKIESFFHFLILPALVRGSLND